MKSKSIQEHDKTPTGGDGSIRPRITGSSVAAVKAVSSHYGIGDNDAANILITKAWPQVQREIEAERAGALPA